MAYVADLDVFRYDNGPFDPQNWAVPLRAVGYTFRGAKSCSFCLLEGLANDCRSRQYREALRAANNGVEIPL